MGSLSRNMSTYGIDDGILFQLLFLSLMNIYSAQRCPFSFIRAAPSTPLYFIPYMQVTPTGSGSVPRLKMCNASFVMNHHDIAERKPCYY